MIEKLKYVLLVLKHKYFVFLAGLKIRTPIWRLLIHDISKLGYHELSGYGDFFFGEKSNDYQFSKSWLHHQNSNDHHWEYWIARTHHDKESCHKTNDPVKINHKVLLEMAADWVGASRCYSGKWPKKNEWKWFNENFDKIILHEESKQEILNILKKHNFV